MTIRYPDPALPRIFTPYRLKNTFTFINGRFGPAVGSDNSVEAEVAIVQFLAEIPAIGIVTGAAGIGFQQSLVFVIPDTSANDPGCRPENIPEFLQVTRGIPHAVGIFHEDNRPVVAGLFHQEAPE